MFNNYYMLMRDLKGWKSLAKKNYGLDYEYLRVQSNLPEVDVPKGSVVKVDPNCQLSDPAVSYIVICLDSFEDQERPFEPIKLSAMNKELMLLEIDQYRILKSISPKERYRIMTEANRYPVVGAKVGDTVYVRKNANSNQKSIGIIQYIGPVDGLGEDAVWFGIELLNGDSGQSDGTLGQRRYFEAEPFTAIFTSADKISLYNEEEELGEIQGRINHIQERIDSSSIHRRGNTPNNQNSFRQGNGDQHQSSLRSHDVHHQQQQQRLHQSELENRWQQQQQQQQHRNEQEHRWQQHQQQQQRQQQQRAYSSGSYVDEGAHRGSSLPRSATVDDRLSRPAVIDSVDNPGRRTWERPNRSSSTSAAAASSSTSLRSSGRMPSSIYNSSRYDSSSRVQQLLKSSDRRFGDRPDHSRPRKSPDAEPNLKVGERVVWLIEKNSPQFGTVRWIGIMPKQKDNDLMAGIEFDHAVGTGTGMVQGQRLFTTPMNHAAILPFDVLMKASDFVATSDTPSGQHISAGGLHTAGRSTFYNSRKISPTFADKLKATVESPKLNRPADELETKKLSPLSQFKRNRSLHQQQFIEDRSGSSSSNRRNRHESDDNGTSLSSNEINWSSGSSPSSRQRSTDIGPPKLPPKKSSPESNRGTINFDPINFNNPGDFDEKPYRNPARDPYASEQFVVNAEVHARQGSNSGHPYQSNKLVDLSDFEDDQSFQHLEPDPVRLDFDVIQDDLRQPRKVELGTLVELQIKKEPHFGLVRWLGYLPTDSQVRMAGIELEEELAGAGNGWHNGTQYFACPDGKGVFVPFTHFRLDSRFEHVLPVPSYSAVAAASVHSNGSAELMSQFGNLECPVVPGSQPAIAPEDMIFLCGRNKGIQGHQNSCYLDATLFAMFSFTSVFDCLLFRPQTPDDLNEYVEVQRVLREEIVNPLRKNYFVRADRVMKLRRLLDSLTSVRGLTSEEKDPEEFLNSLLSQTLRASPFLELSSGQTSHLYQLFVERDESKTLPTVQELFEQSFLTSGVKLKKVPSVMILQMPRFGKQFKVYNRILPSLLLDVTDIIDDSPRQCIVCGKLAMYECLECIGEHGTGLDSCVFCDVCLTKLHNHQKRQRHKWVQLKVPEEFLASRLGNPDCPNRRIFMELFAVVCIETSHYVTFVKCGLGPDAPWCFFDSMADRKGEHNGYNIPEVTNVSRLSNWLSDSGVHFLNSVHDDKALPEQARRLICDGYMCFYQSPEVMMYQ